MPTSGCPEYCARGSLRDLLQHARSDAGLAAALSWERRLVMAIDAAKVGAACQLRHGSGDVEVASFSMLHEGAQAQSAPDGHAALVSILTIPSCLPTGRDVPARRKAAHYPPRPRRPQPYGGEELAHQGVASMQANNLGLAGRLDSPLACGYAWLAAARRHVELSTLCGRDTPCTVCLVHSCSAVLCNMWCAPAGAILQDAPA